MTDGISGVFPGGPSRKERESEAPVTIRGVADFTARERERRRALAREARRRRRLLGLVLALVVAGAAGFAIGRGSGRAPLPADRGMARGDLDRAVSAEVNRVLLELWKMEAAERPGLTRGIP